MTNDPWGQRLAAAVQSKSSPLVVGIDPQRGEVILRSGTDRRRTTAIRTFVRTWQRSDYWAMVVLPPDDLPANVDRNRYFEAIFALEQAGQFDAARTAWQAALRAWPRTCKTR